VFRPAFGTTLTAKVSLLDGQGKVVAGPVQGNSLGQYVLPTSAPPGAYMRRRRSTLVSSSSTTCVGDRPCRATVCADTPVVALVRARLDDW
jgi:hypothetical protein